MKKGFTLIELLVVIAVVAILGSFLFPAFNRAREKGREAGCQNNLHQLHVTFVNYATENDNRLPHARSWYAWDSDNLWHLRVGWVSGLTSAGATLPATVSQPADPTSSTVYYWWYGNNARLGIAQGSVFSNHMNGVYVPYDSPGNSMGVFLCPTFALKTVCGQDDPVRGYSMNAGLSWHNMYGIASAATNVLLGDEQLSGNGPVGGGATPSLGAVAARYDSWFTSAQIASNHTGQGLCVCLDGHIEKR